MPPMMCSTPMATKLIQPVSAAAARSSVALRRSSRKANSTDGRSGTRTLSTVWKCAPSTSGQSSRMASVPAGFGHDSAVAVGGFGQQPAALVIDLGGHHRQPIDELAAIDLERGQPAAGDVRGGG